MTTDTTATAAPTVLVADATVRRTARISPGFVRVTLASSAFSDLARHLGFDTRFKMVLPGPSGRLPLVAPAEEWFDRWQSMPDGERPAMRTYTIREVLEEGADTLLVVDFAVHGPVDTAGPACRWALAAVPGDAVQVVVPHRLGAEQGAEYGGTEFDPDDSRRLLLAGDETAVPAVSRILRDLGPGFTGGVFLEVPTAADVLDVPVRPGIEVCWLPRGDERYGRPLVEAVRHHLGLPPLGADHLAPAVLPEQRSSLDVDVWETPRYSAAGEDVESQLSARTVGSDVSDLYAWIAGESWAVKALRRALVRELGLDRSQVAFMGYWREGVSMRS